MIKLSEGKPLFVNQDVKLRDRSDVWFLSGLREALSADYSSMPVNAIVDAVDGIVKHCAKLAKTQSQQVLLVRWVGDHDDSSITVDGNERIYVYDGNRVMFIYEHDYRPLVVILTKAMTAVNEFIAERCHPVAVGPVVNEQPDDGRAELFEPVRLNARLEARLLAVQQRGGGALKANGDVDAFKRKLLERIDSMPEEYCDEFEENLTEALLDTEGNLDVNVLVDDLNRVQFDFENRYISGNNLDGLKAGYHVVGGLPFILGYAGGDWEFPVVFAIYLGVDGELHGYVPSDGNVYEHVANCAYGSVKRSMIPGSELLVGDRFDEVYNDLDAKFDKTHAVDYELILADVVSHISVGA